MAGTDQKSDLIYSIKNLDIKMINLILDSNTTYLNLEKKNFITILTICFDYFRKKGDDSLEVIDGRCKFSNETIDSYIFSGRQSKNYIEINIEVIDGKVVGLFECYCFPELYTDEVRLYIDSKKGSPF